MAYESFEEYVSSELEDINEKLDLIIEHRNIEDDSNIEDEELDNVEEDSSKVI